MLNHLNLEIFKMIMKNLRKVGFWRRKNYKEGLRLRQMYQWLKNKKGDNLTEGSLRIIEFCAKNCWKLKRKQLIFKINTTTLKKHFNQIILVLIKIQNHNNNRALFRIAPYREMINWSLLKLHSLHSWHTWELIQGPDEKMRQRKCQILLMSAYYR